MEYELGTIKRGDEIGKNGGHRFMFVQCPTCKNTTWTQIGSSWKADNAPHRSCSKCSRRKWMDGFSLEGEKTILT